MDFSFIDDFKPTKATPTAAPARNGVSANALVCSIKTADKRTVLQVRVAQEHIGRLSMLSSGMVTVSLFNASLPPGLEPMDMVTLEGCFEKTLEDGRTFLNAQSVRLLVAKRQVLSESRELVPKEAGRPFIMFVSDAPVTYKEVPGLHRTTVWGDQRSVTWTNKTTNKAECRLRVAMEQRQWWTAAEAGPHAPVLLLSITLWDRFCRQLIQDVDLWRAIMAVHPIPFYVLAHANEDLTTLTVLAVHWELRKYLESDCMELELEQVQTLMPKSAKKAATIVPDKDGLVNMTDKKVIPTGGEEWRYYALSANRASTMEELEGGVPMLLFAVETKKVKAPSGTKRARVEKKSAGK